MNVAVLVLTTVAWAFCFNTFLLSSALERFAPYERNPTRARNAGFPKDRERGFAVVLTLIVALNVLSIAGEDLGWLAVIAAVLALPASMLIAVATGAITSGSPRGSLWLGPIGGTIFLFAAIASENGSTGWRNIARYFFG